MKLSRHRKLPFRNGAIRLDSEEQIYNYKSEWYYESVKDDSWSLMYITDEFKGGLFICKKVNYEK